MTRKRGCCAADVSSVRLDACLFGSSAWFSWLDACSAPSWLGHNSSPIVFPSSPSAAPPCAWLATSTKRMSQTTIPAPADRKSVSNVSSCLPILRANVIFFPKRDTKSGKKAFLCRYETREITPININSTFGFLFRVQTIP